VFDMGRAIVDRRLDDQLGIVWQVPLTGFSAVNTRLVVVSGEAVLTSSADGVVALGAAPPDLRPGADYWAMQAHVKGSSCPGQLMVADEAGMVYRVSPGKAPAAAWDSRMHHGDFSVTGLPDGRLLWDDCDGETGDSELIDPESGQVSWHSPVVLSPVVPVGGQLVGGGVADARGDLISLDTATGAERWRQRRALGAALDIVAAVGGLLWAGDSSGGRLLGFSLDSGRPAATVALPRRTRLVGCLDEAGNLHLADEDGWLIVDLAQARVTADIRFEAAGMGSVYARRTVRGADGRLVLADDRGQVFVVHPERPGKPELVATVPDVKGIGIAAGRVILLSFKGILTALGAA
jgi:outer membrane protein assembly factor BamB